MSDSRTGALRSGLLRAGRSGADAFAAGGRDAGACGGGEPLAFGGQVAAAFSGALSGPGGEESGAPGVEAAAAAGLFPLGVSLRLTGWALAVHGGALAAVWASALPWPVSAGLSALVAASCVRELRLHARRNSPRAVVRLEFAPPPGPRFRVSLAGGATRLAWLRAAPFVHPWLVTLRLRSPEGAFSVVVPSDAVRSPAAHKALRRRLLHGVAT